MFELTAAEQEALTLSLRVALWSVTLSLPFAVAIAWLLARGRFPGKSLINTLVHLPLVLPPVVTGYLLLIVFGRKGLIGEFLAQTFGIVFAFRWTGAVLAAAVMAFPLLVRPIRLSIEAIDLRLESAAATLGANRIAVFLTITLIIPKLLEHVSKIKMEESLFITSLALAFGLAVLANFLGLSSAIGAFLMGMIIASSKFSESVTHKILPLRDFFIIIFFVSIGMLVNIALIPDAIWIAIPIVIVAIVGKFIGNMFSASFAGNTLISASTIGAMMIPIGEFSFIIAKLGVDSGSVRESIFPITILVAIITMLAMPLLLRAVPTIADPRSIIPNRMLETIFYAGMFLRGKPANTDSSSEKTKNMNFKKYGPQFLVHVVVIVTILAAMNYFSPVIISLMEELEISFIIEPEVFLTLLTVVILAYPVFSLFGRTEKMITNISNAITINFGSKEKQLVDQPIHKVVRNLLFIGLILLLVSIFISFVEFEDSTIVIVISIIGMIISLPLILDTFFAIRKITQTHIFDSWMSTGEEDE